MLRIGFKSLASEPLRHREPGRYYVGRGHTWRSHQTLAGSDCEALMRRIHRQSQGPHQAAVGRPAPPPPTTCSAAQNWGTSSLHWVDTP